MTLTQTQEVAIVALAFIVITIILLTTVLIQARALRRNINKQQKQ